MNKTTKNNMINYGLVIALFVIVQILSGTGHLSRLLTGLLVPLCVYTIAAISLNLVVGFSGELSLGHAGFMCVGAYSSALFSHVASDIPQVPRFILAILLGAAVAAVFGVIIGIPVLRLRGDYLAIVTLAFGEIIKNLINILYVGFDENGLHVATSAAGLKLAAGGKQILKGALGIAGTGALYKDVKHYFFPIGIVLVLITLFIVQNLVNSRSGRAVMATRDNPGSCKAFLFLFPDDALLQTGFPDTVPGSHWKIQTLYTWQKTEYCHDISVSDIQNVSKAVQHPSC